MPRLLNLVARSGLKIGGFGRSRAGNVAIVFALSLVPMVGLVGLGVDYGMALSAKSTLDNAADAAALAAVATAKAYVAANPTDPNLNANAISAGKDRATRAFAVNAGKVPFTTTTAPVINLTRSSQTFTSTVQYQATSRNNFGQIFGQKTMSLSGSTGASADIPSYIDFYLLIDVSASMGLPSTLDGQNYLAQNNGNCQFACHFPDQASGYNFAVTKGIQLRSGAVNSAVCSLLGMAKAPAVPNQYRVGLYPFVTQMGTLSPLSSNYTTLWSAATCDQTPPMAFTTLLDSGKTQLTTNGDTSTGIGSGGTHFETSLAAIQSTIVTYGDGSSALKPKPFVFLITDGMQNDQYFDLMWFNKAYYPGGSSIYQIPAQSWWTGTNPYAMNPSLCQSLRNAGATVSILYIPYTTLTVTNLNTWETQQSNAAVPQIPINLTACAKDPTFIHTANTPADINTALQQMFGQAVQVAHLVK